MDSISTSYNLSKDPVPLQPSSSHSVQLGFHRLCGLGFLGESGVHVGMFSEATPAPFASTVQSVHYISRRPCSDMASVGVQGYLTYKKTHPPRTLP